MAKILIMDDEPGLRNVTFSMLKPTGHTLFLAEDGKQAIETARKEKPDLALLDMRVPDYDGLEVLAELKKMDPTIQCIMLSGFSDVETAVGSIKKGAFDYLSKPFKVNEVLDVINKALAQKIKTDVPMQTAVSMEQKVTIEVPKTYVPPGKSKIGLFLGAGVAALVLIVGALMVLGGGREPHEITYSNPSALTFDGKSLWISDWVSRSVYKHKIDKTLSIENVASFPDHTPLGIAWDGEYIWSCDNMAGVLVKHLPNQQLTKISVLRYAGSPTVMSSDGQNNLWVADSGGKIHKFRIIPDGLSPASSFETNIQQPVGIFFYDDSVWVADGETGKINKYDRPNFSTGGVYVLSPYEKGSERLAAVTFDGKHFWSAVNGKNIIYKHPVSDLKLLKG